MTADWNPAYRVIHWDDKALGRDHVREFNHLADAALDLGVDEAKLAAAFEQDPTFYTDECTAYRLR